MHCSTRLSSESEIVLGLIEADDLVKLCRLSFHAVCSSVFRVGSSFICRFECVDARVKFYVQKLKVNGCARILPVDSERKIF